MDITKEISAFTAWLASNPLDAPAQALWMHLLDIWSQSGTPEWIEVANPTLQTKLGVTDKSLVKYRGQLIDRGRIEYEGQQRKKYGKYKIHTFHSALDSSDGISVGKNPSDLQTVGKSDGNSYGNFPTELFAYIDRWIDGMQEGEIDVRTREVQNPYRTFEKNFAKQFKQNMNAGHYEMLKYYLDQGLTIECILLALEDAMNNAAQYPRYLWTVLGSLIANGVRTVPDYAAHMELKAAMNQAAPTKQQGGEQRGSNPRKRSGNGQASGGKVVSITGEQSGWIKQPSV